MKFDEDKELESIMMFHNGNNWEMETESVYFKVPAGMDVTEAFLADCAGGDWGTNPDKTIGFTIRSDEGDFEDFELFFTAAELKSSAPGC